MYAVELLQLLLQSSAGTSEAGGAIMNWKFWPRIAKRDSDRTAGPTTIPEPVARYMVVDLQAEAEWVWHLKAVLRLRSDSKHVYDFRVFEGGLAMAKNVVIQDYASLEPYPDMIVLQGAYHRKSGDVWADTRQPGERLRAA
jgi:hypothetical protein